MHRLVYTFRNYVRVGLHVQKLCTGWFTRSEIMYRLVYTFRNYVQVGLHVQKLCTIWFTRSEIMYRLVYTFRNYVHVGLHVQKLCTGWFTRSEVCTRLYYRQWLRFVGHYACTFVKRNRRFGEVSCFHLQRNPGPIRWTQKPEYCIREGQKTRGLANRWKWWLRWMTRKMRKITGSFTLSWEKRGHLNRKLCGTLAGMKDLEEKKIPLHLLEIENFLDRCS